MNLIKYAKEYWVTHNPILADGVIGFELDTKRIKLGNGINNWNNLEYQPETLGLVPEWFGVRGYATEVEALNNASTDAANNTNILNELIEIAQDINSPINFNKYFYCISNSIVINPQNLSSPQMLNENVTMNGNGATLIIGANVPAILIKSCANTISNFNLTFDKKIFDSVNGRMYFDNAEYIDTNSNYYTASLLKIESGYAKTLAQHNRIINVDAYNPNPWGCGGHENAYYFEDVLQGTAFEINLNEANAYSYINTFENCQAYLLGTAIKLTHTGDAVGNNMQINANTFDVHSWACDKYIEGTGGGNHYSGNTQSNKLKAKYVDENGNDILAKKLYSNPMDTAIWADEENKQAYLIKNDGKLVWADKDGNLIKRTVSGGKVKWRRKSDNLVAYNGNITLFGVPEIDLYPYEIEDNRNESTGTEMQIDNNGIISISGTSSEPEIIEYKILTLPIGTYKFSYEDFMSGTAISDQTYSEYWVEVDGTHYNSDTEFYLAEEKQVKLCVKCYNNIISMSLGNNFQISFKPRLYKILQEREQYKIQKTNEFMINEVGGNISSSIFDNMFYDIETAGSQSEERILKQNSSTKYPVMNQRLVNIKGSGNHFTRMLSQNSIFGNIHKNTFYFKEANSKNVMLTSPILSNDQVNTMNIMPVYNSYDEAMDLEKINLTIESFGLTFTNGVSTFKDLVLEGKYLEPLEADSNEKAELVTEVSAEKVIKLFKNKAEGRCLYIKPVIDNYRINANGECELKDGIQQPYLKLTINGKKLSNFYYKVAPLFAIFTNGGQVYDRALLELIDKSGVKTTIEGKSLDVLNQVVLFTNIDREIIKSMTITLYFKPYITSFKYDKTNNSYSFISNSSALSQFMGQLASWNNGFLNGNTYTKYDDEGNKISDYYATKEEIEKLKEQNELLKQEIELLKKNML